MLPLPCMLVCTFVCANRTRDRGCSKHPVFPAPSDFEGKVNSKPRAQCAARSRSHICVGWVERSETHHHAHRRRWVSLSLSSGRPKAGPVGSTHPAGYDLKDSSRRGCRSAAQTTRPAKALGEKDLGEGEQLGITMHLFKMQMTAPPSGLFFCLPALVEMAMT